jgi:hypothetical protein
MKKTLLFGVTLVGLMTSAACVGVGIGIVIGKKGGIR